MSTFVMLHFWPPVYILILSFSPICCLPCTICSHDWRIAPVCALINNVKTAVLVCSGTNSTTLVYWYIYSKTLLNEWKHNEKTPENACKKAFKEILFSPPMNSLQTNSGQENRESDIDIVQKKY